MGSFEDFDSYIATTKASGAERIRVWAGEKGSHETDDTTRGKIVDDAKRIGEMAKDNHLTISLEYHANTLTDTPESAETLKKLVD